MKKHSIFHTLTQIFGFTLMCSLMFSCSDRPDRLTDTGVSIELAQFRKANYHNVRYKLHFNLPDSLSTKVTGTAGIVLTLDQPEPLIVDFRADSTQVHHLTLNGASVPYTVEREHIIIPESAVQKGENRLEIDFTANDQSLNRREEFLYTLLVPDRARTLFPCFDQPDMKAPFTLSLETPAQWQAIANGALIQTDTLPSGRKKVTFKETEPIPTYLFSFVGGRFERVTETHNGRSVSLYHRETDPQKRAQCHDILTQVFHSLDWLEAYTGISYPFTKYDLIIIPGFQYGGMEHMGATLYADRSMFLDNNATLSNRLGRSSLIAHETAHMWFGDLVTMKWFDDVWTKEVFANFFAAMIVSEQFLQIDHQFNFIRSNVPAAYGEDRTIGSTPIQQQLPNLADAGLLYSQLIYSKSPVVMEMLFVKLGAEKFQEGIREYLHEFSYGNATWNDLIAIFDRRCDEDLASWSKVWIGEKGMPTITTTRQGNQVVLTQHSPFKNQTIWKQPIELLAIKADQSVERVHINLDSTSASATLPAGTIHLLPNSDGRAYGYFVLDSTTSAYLMDHMHTLPDDVARLSTLITLNENVLNGTIAPKRFLEAMVAYLPQEPNQQLFEQALSYIQSCFGLYYNETASPELESALWQLATSGDQARRILSTRAWCAIARSPEALNTLYTIWEDENKAHEMLLGENDLTNLSYTLALRFPDRAEEIVARQAARITNPDRQRQYAYIAPAVSPSQSVRDSVFQSLLDPANRRIEPWAGTALSLLNHPVHGEGSVKYIRPALDELQEVQRTGDIFFPRKWTAALLSSHHSAAAALVVAEFLKAHPDYPPLLASKILQQADPLCRLHPDKTIEP